MNNVELNLYEHQKPPAAQYFSAIAQCIFNVIIREIYMENIYGAKVTPFSGECWMFTTVVSFHGYRC